jgi:hypothetical protein
VLAGGAAGGVDQPDELDELDGPGGLDEGGLRGVCS